MSEEFDAWYAECVGDENKPVREAAKAAWEYMLQKVKDTELDAAGTLNHLAKCLDQVDSGEVMHDLWHLADHARADARMICHYSDGIDEVE